MSAPARLSRRDYLARIQSDEDLALAARFFVRSGGAPCPHGDPKCPVALCFDCSFDRLPADIKAAAIDERRQRAAAARQKPAPAAPPPPPRIGRDARMGGFDAPVSGRLPGEDRIAPPAAPAEDCDF